MSAYLSADELASLIGCKPNSRACMRRWPSVLAFKISSALKLVISRFPLRLGLCNLSHLLLRQFLFLDDEWASRCRLDF